MGEGNCKNFIGISRGIVGQPLLVQLAEEVPPLEEFPGGPAGGDPAVLEGEDLVAEFAEPADVVVHDHDGAAGTGLAEAVEEGEFLEVVDAGGGLIEQEEAGAAQEAEGACRAGGYFSPNFSIYIKRNERRTP